MRTFGAAVVPANGAAFTGATPQFAGIVHTGTGVYTITLAGGGIDSAECAHAISEVGTLAGSGMSSFALSHTSDTVKVVTALREAAAGAASVAADIAFALVLVSTRAGIDPS